MPDSDDGRWLTYAEAGQLLGVSSEAARQMARRKGWPRRTPNERGAVAHIQVPADLGTVRPRTAINGGRTPVDLGTNGSRSVADERPDATPDILRTVQATVELLMMPIREQLDRERQRADEERGRADRERERADRAERRITELQSDLNRRTPDPPRTRWQRFKRWRKWPA